MRQRQSGIIWLLMLYVYFNLAFSFSGDRTSKWDTHRGKTSLDTSIAKTHPQQILKRAFIYVSLLFLVAWIFYYINIFLSLSLDSDMVLDLCKGLITVYSRIVDSIHFFCHCHATNCYENMSTASIHTFTYAYISPWIFKRSIFLSISRTALKITCVCEAHTHTHTSDVTSDETSICVCIDGPIILLKKGWNFLIYIK